MEPRDRIAAAILTAVMFAGLMLVELALGQTRDSWGWTFAVMMFVGPIMALVMFGLFSVLDAVGRRLRFSGRAWYGLGALGLAGGAALLAAVANLIAGPACVRGCSLSHAMTLNNLMVPAMIGFSAGFAGFAAGGSRRHRPRNGRATPP